MPMVPEQVTVRVRDWVLELTLLLLQPHIKENKLTQKDSADSGVQFITLAGPRQSLLLAKDPDQFLWKPLVYMLKPTSPNSLKLVWTKEKERYNQS